MMYEKFQKQMNKVLEGKGMNEYSLSTAIGYDTKSVHNAFKNSYSGPGKAMLERIADYLEMTLVYRKGEYQLVNAVPTGKDHE